MKAEDLRKSILQLAIQGKLVPQDPNDEPASVLLECIRAEKQKLIKEGKIKKDKGESIIFKGDDNRHYEKIGNEIVCIDEEVADFDIPETWCFCRMSAIANIFTGNSINETEKQRKYFGLSNGYNYIATKDVSFEHTINYENGVKIPYGEDNFKIAYKDTPLLCIEGGSAGRKIAILEQDVCFGNKLCAFQSLGVDPKYLYYYLQNPFFIRVFKSKTTGIIGGVSVNTLKTLLFVLPPLAEQARIVAEIEKFEPLIAEYDKLEQQATKLDNEIYDNLKKSILQYAIQGKLVPQDPNDEPASVLLARIRAEKKAQLGKKYVESYIYKGDDNCYYEKVGKNEPVLLENLPFDIPDSWCWARIGTIGDWGAGATPSRSNPEYYNGNIPWIKTGELNDGYIYSSEETITEQALQKCSLRYNKIGDVLIAMYGATIGKLAIAGVELTTNQACCACTPYKGLSNIYLFYFLKEEKDRFIKLGAGGAQPNISREKIVNYLIPIPPYNEQIRICNQIEIVLDKLKDEN